MSILLGNDLPEQTLQRIRKLVVLERFRPGSSRWPFRARSGGATRWEVLFRLDDWLTDLFGEDTTWKLLFKLLDLPSEHHFEMILQFLKTASELSLFSARLLLMPETAAQFVPEDIAEALYDESHPLSGLIRSFL
jgi:hypothetical protein